MGTHSQTTCGSERPAICSRTGGQSWKAVLATPCLAGKAEEDLSWGSSFTFYFNTPEAFNKNTLGCRKSQEGDQTLGPASSRSEPRAGEACSRCRASAPPSAPHPRAPPGPSSSAASGSQMWRASPHCSLAVPGKKEIATQTTRKPPPPPPSPKPANSETERAGALSWQRAILSSWKWGERGCMCACESACSKIKLSAQASPKPVPTAT